MDGEIKYLSKSQFAIEQGWSPSYVTKLNQQGRLVLCEKNKQVNVKATLEMLGKTSDPGKESIRQHHAAGRVEKNVGVHVRPDTRQQDDTAPSTGADPKYWDKKTRREGALAEMAEIELAKKLGELVDRKRVEAAAFASGRTLRDAVLGLPTRLAPVFASMTDAFEIETALRDALRQVFADTAKMTADDLDFASEQSH